MKVSATDLSVNDVKEMSYGKQLNGDLVHVVDAGRMGVSENGTYYRLNDIHSTSEELSPKEFASRAALSLASRGGDSTAGGSSSTISGGFLSARLFRADKRDQSVDKIRLCRMAVKDADKVRNVSLLYPPPLSFPSHQKNL